MKTHMTLLVACSLGLFAIGCGGGDSNNGDGGMGGNAATSGCTSMPVTTTPQPMACKGATVVASEADNYRFTSEIKLPPVTVKSMTNLTFDWSAVTRDFLGHTLNPAADIDVLVLLMWELSLSKLETDLNADTLQQIYLRVSPPPSWPGPGMTVGGMTSVNLHAFTLNGTAISEAEFNMFFDPVMFPSGNFTYMIGAQTGTELGRGFRMLQTFNLDPASSNTTVALKNDSTRLTCSVSLRNLTITGVPGGTAALSLDWSQMDTNAMGAPFLEGVITRAVVGHYTQTPEQLESKFLDLELIADKFYRADITSGSVLDFTTLRDDSGASFTGIDDTGTWMVGLFCGNCQNPAPWYMTILKPCTAP